MKKFVLLCCMLVTVSSVDVFAHSHHRYYGSSCSSCVYVVRSDYFENDSKFENCDSHYLNTKTTVNYYSNGTKRTFSSYTIFNDDGTVLVADCTAVKHILYDGEHYFILRKGGYYKVVNAKAQDLTVRKYKSMKQLEPNALLVSLKKRYGVIKLDETTIIPLKYKSFEHLTKNLYLTKLNGYYGIIDRDFNILLRNEFDKIT